MSKFWGLQCAAGAETIYPLSSNSALQLSNAAINPKNGATGNSTLYVKHEKREFALCTLSEDCPQAKFDLAFYPTSGNLCFVVDGSHEIHLTGQLETINEDELDNSEDEDEDQIENSSEQVDEINSCQHKKRLRVEGKDEETAPRFFEENAEKKVKKAKRLSFSDLTQKLETAKEQKRKATNEEEKEKEKERKVKKKTEMKRLPNGLKYQDKVIGTGGEARKGKKCSMHYVGRLKNGKVFDESTHRGPFRFRLGVGEVIKGWDIGIANMRVGGERTLYIPSNLAYGRRGAPPDIPPNSALIFDVKLLKAKIYFTLNQLNPSWLHEIHGLPGNRSYDYDLLMKKIQRYPLNTLGFYAIRPRIYDQSSQTKQCMFHTGKI